MINIQNKKFFKATISKMGKLRMINVPKNELDVFKSGDRVIVILEENDGS